jgi:chromate reductase, NAD(P)H dehydrogenase (quinone)
VCVLGFAGSLRRDSYNSKLLQAAAQLFPNGVVFELWRGIGDLPAYNEDLDRAEPPATVVQLRQDIATADALLFATPEYNASVPGGLKNTLDWASRPYTTNVLRRKPVAVIGASTGLFGAIWAQAELRKILSACGARVLDRQLPVARADDAFAPDGSLADPELAAALAVIVRDLVGAARPNEVRKKREQGQSRTCDYRREPTRARRNALSTGTDRVTSSAGDPHFRVWLPRLRSPRA